MSAEEEIGTLIVVVLKAQNLNDKHFFKQDVYAQITFNGVTKKTKIDYKGGQHPMWDEELRFPVMKDTAQKYRQLEASCWAKEHKDDALLGEAKVDMTPTLKSGEFDEWVSLSTSSSQRGEIYLEITYYSNAPVPAPAPAPSSKLAVPVNLVRRPSKLSPAERLSRPQQSGPRTPPKDHHLPLPGSYPPDPIVKPGPGAVPSTLKPGPGVVPSTLKPGPGAVPSTLKPGPAAGAAAASRLTPAAGPTRVSPKQHQQPLPVASQPSHAPQNAAAAVPSILRPGNPQSDPHASGRRSSSSSPRQSQFGHATSESAPYPPTTQSVYPNPYDSTYRSNGGIPYASSTPMPQDAGSHMRYPSAPAINNSTIPPANPNGGIPYASSTPVPHHPPYTHRQTSNPSVMDWSPNAQPEGPISFPVPNFPGAVPTPAPTGPLPNASFGSGFYTPPYGATPPPLHQRATSFSHLPQPSRTASGGNDLPDPYLIARYQTPLPLPPGAQASAPSSTSSSPGSSAHHQRARSTSVEPEPPTYYRPTPPVPPHPQSQSPSSYPSLDLPPTEAPIRSRTPVDESRLKALRQAEEEAARRRAQEEKDMELARRLDLEEAEREEREREQQKERQRRIELEKANKPPSPPPKPRSKSPSPFERAQAQRKMQEEKDAELARQLDKELNL
ncbi:hypothetical protein GYMLUDRAFT_198242 [Collybiopsis luxurians FD-317 M1]|uniref:C2 domain-containing protein n=1 Tax=Collybiopsis luxurians FD-317 M1 TaxID=944289 RepID=A0A0D0BFB2_9AGAR|nr:hypothetical protein GYMLUDRAFT_198242 [Collybiopsis luxurians FD-317 M1]